MNKRIVTVFKWIVPLFILMLGFVFFGWLTSMKESPTKKARLMIVPSVNVISAKPKKVTLTVRSQGTVAARTAIDLVAEVSGKIITIAPNFRVGNPFSKGDLLAVLESVSYRSILAQRHAAVANANLLLLQEQAKADQATIDWNRNAQGMANPLVLRMPHLEKAKANLASALAQRDHAAYQLEKTEIRAPFSGRIAEKFSDIGSFANAGNTILARLYEDSILEVALPISSRQFSELGIPDDFAVKDSNKGLRVLLSCTQGNRPQEWKGSLTRVSGTIDPKTRLFSVVVTVRRQDQNPGTQFLKPGDFVEASIQGKSVESVYVLPRLALFDEKKVRVVTKQNKLSFRKVDLLKTTPEKIYIQGGLTEGELVNVTPLDFALEGIEVAPVPYEGDPKK